MFRRWKSLVYCGLVFGLSATAQADVKLHGLFDDHAVLQRDMPIPVWGTADTGEKITVSLNGTKAEATAADGKWSVKLPAQKAGGPYELVVSGPKNKIELKDVLVGEVWICGGQSNMEWPVDRSENPAEVKAGATNSKIRLITIQRHGADTPKTDVDAAWKVCAGKHRRLHGRRLSLRQSVTNQARRADRADQLQHRRHRRATLGVERSVGRQRTNEGL
ncbi:MAG: hypothetical protein QM811_15770 [Pirellulales bacterium]